MQPSKGTTAMTATTLAAAIEDHGVEVLEHLDRQATIPTVTTLGRQGDVLIVRRGRGSAATTPIPREGFPAVRGENGGNTHLLLGDACYDPRDVSATDLELGTLTVGADGAYLAHPEHGYLAIAPGNYTLRRQREQADQLRLVAD